VEHPVNKEKCDLYRAFDADGTLLYVGISWAALVRIPQHSKKEWFSNVARIEITKFGSREDALSAEKQAVIDERPQHNIIWACSDVVASMDLAMTPAEIKATRLSFGLDQKDMATMLGYSTPARVSELERGVRVPSDAVLRLLRSYLDGYRPPDWPR
jgi:DNA-binding transcriptional regulator YiaG